MADIHGSPGDAPRMPSAPNSGPAPVPYGGADLSPEPPVYAAELGPLDDAGANVMSGVTGLNTTESPVAHDVNAGLVTPYYAGAISPINAAGDDDAGGRDDVSATVAGAVANATGRWQEFQSDTYGQGSTYGDLMTFPPGPLDPGAVGGLKGGTDPSGSFYDPPRGGSPQTFPNTGNEPG